MKPIYSYGQPDTDGTVGAFARYKNTRITMMKNGDGSFSLLFERAAEADDKHAPPHAYIDGRKLKSYIKLSDTAMRTVVALWMGFEGNRIELPFIRETPKTTEPCP